MVNGRAYERQNRRPSVGRRPGRDAHRGNTEHSMALTPTGLVAKTLLLAVAYYLSASLGLLLQFADAQASPVWPPSGLAFAAVLLLGSRTGGGILLGEFLANLVDLYVKTTADPQLPQIGFLSYALTHPPHLLATA